MRIHINAGPGVTDQCRAYTEYRFFAAVSRFDAASSHVIVALDAGLRSGGCRCTATLVLRDQGRVGAAASADHLHAAIDLAAHRLCASTEKRLGGIGREGAKDPSAVSIEGKELK